MCADDFCRFFFYSVLYVNDHLENNSVVVGNVAVILYAECEFYGDVVHDHSFMKIFFFLHIKESFIHNRYEEFLIIFYNVG